MDGIQLPYKGAPSSITYPSPCISFAPGHFIRLSSIGARTRSICLQDGYIHLQYASVYTKHAVICALPGLLPLPRVSPGYRLIADHINCRRDPVLTVPQPTSPIVSYLTLIHHYRTQIAVQNSLMPCRAVTALHCTARLCISDHVIHRRLVSRLCAPLILDHTALVPSFPVDRNPLFPISPLQPMPRTPNMSLPSLVALMPP